MSRADGTIESEAINKFLHVEGMSDVEKASVRGQIDAAGFQSLRALRGKLARISGGASVRASVLSVGDSVANDLLLPIRISAMSAYGVGGQVGGGTIEGIQTTLAGGAATGGGTTIADGADFSKSLTGQWINVPAGGSITKNIASYWSPYLGAFTPTAIKVYYTKESGGGTFKVQTSPDGSVWTDVVGYTSISASGSPDMGIATVPVASLVQWRIVGVSGNVKVLDTGFLTAAGFVAGVGIASGGGRQIKEMMTAPSAMWATFLADFAPDLTIVHFKDFVDADLVTALATLQGYIATASPNGTTVYQATYNSQKDDPGAGTTPANTAAVQNATLRTHTQRTDLAGEMIYWDGNSVLGTYATANALGLFNDTIHANDAGRLVLAHAFNRDFALGLMIDAKLNGVTRTAAELISSGIFPVAGGTITGKIRISNTTDATGISEGSNGDAAIRTAGGIYAAKGVRSDTGFFVGTDPSSGRLGRKQQTSASGFTIDEAILNLSNASSGSHTGYGYYTQMTLAPTSTANNTSFFPSAIRAEGRTSGSGTGTITALTGVTGLFEHTSSHVVSTGRSYSALITCSGSGNTTAAYAYDFFGSKSGAGTVAKISVFRCPSSFDSFTATTKYFFENESAQPSITAGDIEISAIGKGVILKSPDGTRYRMTVANGGTAVFTAL